MGIHFATLWQLGGRAREEPREKILALAEDLFNLSRARSKELDSANGHSPPAILVVDDDPDILEALSEILESEGFVIRQARNGQEALELLENLQPSLILLDLMMPVMDGWEFAERIRRRQDWAQIPVIVLSADRNIGGKARELGALGYLAKPFELSELLSLVQTSLSERRKTKAQGRSH